MPPCAWLTYLIWALGNPVAGNPVEVVAGRLAAEVPELLVWLSAQSLLVVTTAIWFRSRFIIVANFLIYLAVVGCYMVLVEQENGIILVFGLVALASSRNLKWQKDRLELKTELMRNAYLTCAFIVLPYAFYHIVPQAWVALQNGESSLQSSLPQASGQPTFHSSTRVAGKSLRKRDGLHITSPL